MTLGKAPRCSLPGLQEGPICTKCKDEKRAGGVLLSPGWRAGEGGEEQKWRVGSAAVVTETSKPSPLGAPLSGATFTWRT